MAWSVEVLIADLALRDPTPDDLAFLAGLGLMGLVGGVSVTPQTQRTFLAAASRVAALDGVPVNERVNRAVARLREAGVEIDDATD